jgi:hypothetical protein
LKKQRAEEAKRQRSSKMKMEYETRLNAVNIVQKECFTMDDDTTDVQTMQWRTMMTGLGKMKWFGQASLMNFGLTLQLMSLRLGHLISG